MTHPKQESGQTYDYTYTGEYQPPTPDPDPLRDPQGREYFPYLPEPGLKKAIALAIALQRPLLLEGAPGCGKTRVASALAYELARRNLGKEPPRSDHPEDWWHFYIWNITSTSRARDGLYTFDAVGRLRDAQLIGSDPQRLENYLGKEETKALRNRLKDKTEYLQFGALGDALREQNYRPVVLIDEIDKADSDFPNDLLLVLDELRFTIAETGEDVPAPPSDRKPIILITSNREKPLPEPFLRRCLYYCVPFPDTDTLKQIVKVRFGEGITDKQKLVDEALTKFQEVQRLLQEQPGSRPPGTSELLEFLTALIQQDKPMSEAWQELEQLAEELPLLGTLIKTKADQERYQNYQSSSRRKSEA